MAYWGSHITAKKRIDRLINRTAYTRRQTWRSMRLKNFLVKDREAKKSIERRFSQTYSEIFKEQDVLPFL
jgi:hypothetical protein